MQFGSYHADHDASQSSKANSPQEEWSGIDLHWPTDQRPCGAPRMAPVKAGRCIRRTIEASTRVRVYSEPDELYTYLQCRFRTQRPWPSWRARRARLPCIALSSLRYVREPYPDARVRAESTPGRGLRSRTPPSVNSFRSPHGPFAVPAFLPLPCHYHALLEAHLGVLVDFTGNIRANAFPSAACFVSSRPSSSLAPPYAAAECPVCSSPCLS